MLRAIAILLINLISFGLVAPAFLTGAPLPACCRDHGKHHCAMKMAQAADSGVPADTMGEKCSCSLKTWTAASNSQSFVPRGSQMFFGDVLSHSAVQAQTEALYRISFSRSRQKRGPPSSLFS